MLDFTPKIYIILEAVSGVDVVVIAGFHMLETLPTVQQHAVSKDCCDFCHWFYYYYFYYS